MKKNALLCMGLFLLSGALCAQDDLLEVIDGPGADAQGAPAFKGVKIVNFESTKLLGKREFYFVVSHRFGSISNGFDDFFGLDFANTRLQLIYGITDGVNVSLSRHSFNKTYETSLKYTFLTQKAGVPVSLAGYSQLALNTQLDEALLAIPVAFSDRVSVTQQLLISRRFNDRLSLQVMPTFFHEGYVDYPGQDNAQWAMGFGGRYKLGPRWSINMDYGWHLNRAEGSPFRNPLSIGVDIETGGHVFQLHLTNAQPTFESGFLGQAVGDWSQGIIYFGFNISRVFNF